MYYEEKQKVTRQMSHFYFFWQTQKSAKKVHVFNVVVGIRKYMTLTFILHFHSTNKIQNILMQLFEDKRQHLFFFTE